MLITELLPSPGKEVGVKKPCYTNTAAAAGSTETSRREPSQVVSELGTHDAGEVSFSLQLCLQKASVKRTDQMLRQQVLTVGIRHDDVWTLPSELQRHPLQVTLCCSLLDQVPNLQQEKRR